MSLRLGVVLAALVMMSSPTGVTAEPDPPTDTFDYTSNMEPLGASLRPATDGVVNSDLAFWGDLAVQGTYDGFRLIDISDPEDPRSINDYAECSGSAISNQGDVILYEDLLVRSWNVPAPGPPGPGDPITCDGEPVVPGFEGLHLFDIADRDDPDLVGSVDLECGSHTATAVPDPANERLIVYSSASSTDCPGIDIVRVPLSTPETATFIRREPSGRSCHDTSVILGDAMLAACSGGNGLTAFGLGGARGGTLEDPLQLWTKRVQGVSIGHSATFSWDGSILAFGHEPGGGVQPECQESDDTVKKTLFFFDSGSGDEMGRWVLPRPQTSEENCSIHNFNVVPNVDRRILVSGNYQSGVSVVDFTNPAQPREVAYADPEPLSPQADGGDWSAYWYDGTIYESDQTRGLITWQLNDPVVIGSQTLGHLNPQTQESTLTFAGEVVTERCKGRAVTHFGTLDRDVLRGTPGPDVIAGLGGSDVVWTGKGKDVICGGKDRDRLIGQGGNDLLAGQRGKDLLVGGPGNDRCTGGRNRDRARTCEAGRV